MKLRNKLFMVIMVLTLLTSIGVIAPVQAQSTRDNEAVSAAAQTRKALALSSDPVYIAGLRNSVDDAGSARWGIPLTKAEAAEVQARFAFASATRKGVLPFVETLPTFAGAFFDHQQRGELVILLTAANDSLRSKIQALAPTERRTRVQIVAHTETELRAALPATWEIWKAISGPEAYAIAVDTPNNAIRIDVDAANLKLAKQYITKVSTAVGLPVVIGVGEKPKNSACNSRDINCFSPMYAGMQIRQGSVTGGLCTMGFHIKVNTDVQFLTAGHCAYTGSVNWYHPGYGFIGANQISQYISGGRDIRTVQMDDNQSNTYLFANRSVAVNGMLDPYAGEGVCASRGNSSTAWGCGVVETAYTSWNIAPCYCVVYGGDSTISGIPGDSGSPIVDANDIRIAIGILDTSAGHFARVEDALTSWGYKLR